MIDTMKTYDLDYTFINNNFNYLLKKIYLNNNI